MCYVLLLSTTSDQDLSESGSDLARFTRTLPDVAAVVKLAFPNRWYVESKPGCSCGFRHLYSVDLGFGRPVDWYPEEPDDIKATLEVIALIRRLVAAGEKVDCVDAWEHRDMHPVAEATLTVDLSQVADEEFRFFENHRFVFEHLDATG